MEEIETISTARWRLEITLRFDESPIHFNIRSMGYPRIWAHNLLKSSNKKDERIRSKMMIVLY